MAPTHLKWLLQELGYAFVADPVPACAAASDLTAHHDSAPARGQISEAHGSVRGQTIEKRVAALLSLSEDDARLTTLCARARQGVPGVLVLGSQQGEQGGTRLLALPGATAGELTLVFAPIIDLPAMERRAALTDVAAAVSHEVANALSAIGGWADLALRADSGVDPIYALGLIGRCVRTAESAARHLLNLAKGQPSDDGEPSEASALTTEVVELLSVAAREARVSLKVHVEPELLIAGSRPQLFSVVWNLAKNAIEACAGRGQVEVILRGEDQQVVLEVRDDGPGMNAEACARVFSPYYTTKVLGTGLGLSLVQETIKTMGGSIQVHSRLGHGTVFSAALPRVYRPSAVRAPIKSDRVRSMAELDHEVPPQIDASVLVVDDDPALRELISTALALKGARVTTAASACAAQELAGPFDIALIDMVLKDGRGDELLSALRRRGTVNAAMLVTGTAQRTRMISGGEPDDWVRKPFELSQLIDRLKRTLERHRMLSVATATVRM